MTGVMAAANARPAACAPGGGGSTPRGSDVRGVTVASLRGAKRRPFSACCASFAGLGVRRSSESEGGSNPAFLLRRRKLDCFASLAMTDRDNRELRLRFRLRLSGLLRREGSLEVVEQL